MDDNRRSMLTLLVVSALAYGGYMVYQQYFVPKPQHSAPAAIDASADGDGVDGADGADADGADADDGRDPAQLVVDREARLAAQQTATIRTDDYEATVTNLNGGITHFALLRDRYQENGAPVDIVNTDHEEYFPLHPKITGVPIPPDAVWEIEQVSARQVRLTWEGAGFRVVEKLEAGQGPYQLWSTVRVVNLSERARPVRIGMGTYHYVARSEESGGFLGMGSRSPKISHGVCYYGDDEITRLDREKGLPAGSALGHGFGPNVGFVGTENSYFASVVAAGDGAAERCRLLATDRFGGTTEALGSLFESTLIYPRAELAPGGHTTARTLAYFGPKDNDALFAAGHHLPEVVDLGWFSIVARYFVALLRWFYSVIGNWGLAIIMMTLLVRLLLLPLTWKSFQSMAQLRVLKPEIDALNEKYKDDQQQKGMAVMELYRKRGVSPFGGCLPSLLQMPVWFAFYASLSSNVELYHAHFAGFYTDLSARDPFFILPLLVGALMHLQQRLTPAATDPTQAKVMMWVMPIMITTFLLFLPAGLCLYMVTNSILGMGQQLYIQKNLKKKETDARVTGASPGRSGGSSGGRNDEEEDVADGDDDEVDDSDVRSSSVLSRTRPKSQKKRRRTRRA